MHNTQLDISSGYIMIKIILFVESKAKIEILLEKTSLSSHAHFSSSHHGFPSRRQSYASGCGSASSGLSSGYGTTRSSGWLSGYGSASSGWSPHYGSAGSPWPSGYGSGVSLTKWSSVSSGSSLAKSHHRSATSESTVATKK